MYATHIYLKILAVSTGITLTALGASSACAQGFDTVRLHGAPGIDAGSFSAALITTTQYQGSDKRRTLALPVLDYQWANGWFAGVSNGIGYNFSQSEQLQFGLRLTIDEGRKESRASALRGMGDVDAAAEGGAFFNYSPTQGLRLNSSVRYGSGNKHNGVVLDVGADYTTTIASNLHLSAATGITVTNAKYMQSFFGVTSSQSSASGYVTREADAGVRDVRAKLALTDSIDPKTSITGAVSVSSLLNDAKDSPLTRKRTAGSGVIAITYAF